MKAEFYYALYSNIWIFFVIYFVILEEKIFIN